MNINKTFLFFLLALISFNGFSQIKYGAKLNIGTSWISSSNLKDNFEFQMNNDPEISEWDVDYVPGIMAGLGAVLSYDLNTAFALQAELSFDYQQSNININYVEVGTAIESEVTISSSRIALPLSVHYALGPDKPVLFSGFEINLIGKPDLESIEQEIVNNNTVDAEAVEGDMDTFANTRINFLLGAGKSIELGDNTINLQLCYHLPLNSSEMYNTTASGFFDDNTMKNNEVFGVFGATDAAQEVPQYPLNDFKMHFLDLSVSYFFN